MFSRHKEALGAKVRKYAEEVAEAVQTGDIDSEHGEVKE